MSYLIPGGHCVVTQKSRATHDRLQRISVGVIDVIGLGYWNISFKVSIKSTNCQIRLLVPERMQSSPIRVIKSRLLPRPIIKTARPKMIFNISRSTDIISAGLHQLLTTSSVRGFS